MKTVEVVCALIRKDNKVFICQRGKGKNLEDFYEFPGGKIELGETKEQALMREIKEELNSDISVDEYIMTVEHDYPTFHITMHAFWCTLLKGKLELLEHKDSKWVTIEEMKKVNFAPADIIIINKFNG